MRLCTRVELKLGIDSGLFSSLVAQKTTSEGEPMCTALTVRNTRACITAAARSSAVVVRLLGIFFRVLRLVAEDAIDFISGAG